MPRPRAALRGRCPPMASSPKCSVLRCSSSSGAFPDFHHVLFPSKLMMHPVCASLDQHSIHFPFQLHVSAPCNTEELVCFHSCVFYLTSLGKYEAWGMITKTLLFTKTLLMPILICFVCKKPNYRTFLFSKPIRFCLRNLQLCLPAS